MQSLEAGVLGHTEELAGRSEFRACPARGVRLQRNWWKSYGKLISCQSCCCYQQISNWEKEGHRTGIGRE